MPYTPAQRRLWHELDENPAARREHGVSGDEAHRLANEADDLAREGREKKPKQSAKSNFIDLSSIFNPSI
jgi:hypothetical protein